MLNTEEDYREDSANKVKSTNMQSHRDLLDHLSKRKLTQSYGGSVSLAKPMTNHKKMMHLFLQEYPKDSSSYNRKTDFDSHRKSPSNLSLMSARMLRDHVQKSSRAYVEMHSKKLLESMLSPTITSRGDPTMQRNSRDQNLQSVNVQAQAPSMADDLANYHAKYTQ